MAGLSSRFTKAGYAQPKYMLPVDHNTVFFHAVNSFKNYFDTCEVLFIFRDIQSTKEFIDQECIKMNLHSYQCIELDEPTEGQAETVYLGMKKASVLEDDSILIFNIDTFRPNFKLPPELDFNMIDGYLEVFEAEGDHWSFVLPESTESNRVIKTTEKERISSLCSSGLYYFRKADTYKNTFRKIFEKDERSKNEFYIAPMYNYLINEGKDIRFSKITLDDIIFCGTPDEYIKLKGLRNANSILR